MADVTEQVADPSVDVAEVAEKTVTEAIQQSVEIVDQVSDYGYLIVDSLYLIMGGMLAIFLVHVLVSRLVYPYFKNLRLIKVVLGTFYVLILVVAVLILLKKLGFDVSVISRVAVISVLISAVVVFFLVPFLPRLPFKLGHLIEAGGVFGVVQGLSTYHTTIRTIDGAVVFVPNALLMASKIVNYHDSPERRIDFALELSFDCDLDEVKTQMLGIMEADNRIVSSPTPPGVLVTGADASGAKVTAYCWVKNKGWLGARSDLWTRVLAEFQNNELISLSRPEQDVYLKNES